MLDTLYGPGIPTVNAPVPTVSPPNSSSCFHSFLFLTVSKGPVLSSDADKHE